MSFDDLFPLDVDSLQDTCRELDVWRERLDHRGSLSRRWAGRLRRELEAQAIGSSLAMEQIPVTIDQVRQVLAGLPPPEVDEGDVALVNGYREAMGFVLRRADEAVFRWNRELITGIHDRVLAGNWGKGAGKLRDGPVYIVNTGTGEVRFMPPSSEDVPALIDRACEIIESCDWHPAITSGWIHLTIAAIHPFSDGNGRTSRVLASLAMYRGGFRLPEFTSLEEWWGRHREDY
jgi:Fic family protein